MTVTGSSPASAGAGAIEFRPRVLVLDDYHVIDSRAIDNALAFLLTICRPTCTRLTSLACPPVGYPVENVRRKITGVKGSGPAEVVRVNKSGVGTTLPRACSGETGFER